MRNTPLQQEQDILQKIAQTDYKLDQSLYKRPSVPVHYTDPDLDSIPAGYQWLLASDPSAAEFTPSVHKVFDGTNVLILSQTTHQHTWPEVEVGRTSNFTHTSTANWQVVPWNKHFSGSSLMHSTTVNPENITITEDGTYSVTAILPWSTNATGRRICALYINASGAQIGVQANELDRDERTPATAGNSANCKISWSGLLRVGWWLTIAAYQTSGGNLDIQNVGNYMTFNVVKLADLPTAYP